MVSTKIRIVRTRETRFSSIDIFAILEVHAKMHVELIKFKERSGEKMDALRQENAKLKRRVKDERTDGKGKDKEILDNMNLVQKTLPHIHGNEEENKYNHTPKTHNSSTSLIPLGGKLLIWTGMMVTPTQMSTLFSTPLRLVSTRLTMPSLCVNLFP